MIAYPKLSLKYKFEVTEVAGERVAVCLDEGADDFHGIIKLKNDSAAFMFEKMAEGTTVHALITECMKRYNVTVEEAGPIVLEFIAMLKDKNLIKSERTTDDK